MNSQKKGHRRNFVLVLVFAGLLASVLGAGRGSSKLNGTGPSDTKIEAAANKTGARTDDQAGAKTSHSALAASSLSAHHSSLLSPQSGGDFDIPSSVIAGGGGTSSDNSSNLTLDGTMGQAAAGTTMNDQSGQFSLNGGFWQAVTCTLRHSIGGKVNYQDSSTGVKSTDFALNGSPSAATTDTGGLYTVANLLDCGNYTLTPSKTGDVNGVTAFDASLAARFAAGLISLSNNKRLAGDASNNGSVSAFDASLIARTAANIPNTGIAGTWKFVPPTLTINNLDGDKSNLNTTAVLIGDVSGNWMPPAGPSPLNPASASAPIAVALPNKQDPPGSTSTVPISVGDTTGQSVASYDFDVMFDPNVLQPQATPFDTTGTLSSGWSIIANTSTPGHLVINAFSTQDLTGQGTLLKLKFNVPGAGGAQTPLTWQSFNFNEGTPGDADINGQFTVASPTAAPAIISGQVFRDNGAPVSGTTITLTGGPRVIRAITNSNGFYKIENVSTGAFYTVTPSRANYVFGPPERSFSLLADKTDAVFTGMPITETANPLDSQEFFVRQQYLDFLGREPDQRGLDFWAGQLRHCGADAACLRVRRIDVSAAFFQSPEFQESGSFVYVLYQNALGRQLSYAEFSAARSAVVGGPNLDTSKAAFLDGFVQRADFVLRYQTNATSASFVDALLQTVYASTGVDLSAARANLINRYDSGATMNQSRSLVLRDLTENTALSAAIYNPSFVLMEYFGYLRRERDRSGYDFWLNILNNREPGNFRGMVCAFVTSAEYQHRFSSVLSHTNGECGN